MFPEIKITDRNGVPHFELTSPRTTQLRSISWAGDNRSLAVITAEGNLQMWNLAAMDDWESSIGTN